MRAAYSTNKSKEELKILFRRIFQNLASDIFEFVEGEDISITVRKNEKLFRAVIRDSTIYVEGLGSGIDEMLKSADINFSFSQFVKIPDKRIEDYFKRNGYL